MVPMSLPTYAGKRFSYAFPRPAPDPALEASPEPDYLREVLSPYDFFLKK